MKAIIIALVIAVCTPFTSFASDRCTMISGLAESAMDARQQEVPKTELLRAIAGTDLSADTREVAVAITEAAYTHPVYVEEDQKAAISYLFAVEVKEACLSTGI